MEGLPEELGACEATMDPCGIPAALHDRGNARVLLNFQSGIVAAAVRAHGREEAWRHDRASARETVKDVTILMLVEQYVNLGLDAIDGIDQATQLRNQGLKDRYRCGDHRGVLGERTGGADLLQALLDDFCPAAAMLLVELAYLGRFGLLQLYQSRPLLQKIAGHGSVQLAGPGERLRKVLFERLREHIGDDDSAPDGVATKLRQFLQRPGLRLIGSPDFYFIPVIPGPFEQKAGIGNIILSATGVEGLPIPGQRLGRDAHYMDKVTTEQRIDHRSAALLNSDDHISSAESIAQAQDPIMQGLGCLFDGLCLDPAGASCLQRDRMLLVSPIEPDTSGVLLLLVGSIGLHGCLLPVVLRTRWLWSCAILIVESSVGTASEYALLDQSASSRSNLSGKPSKRLERDIRSGAMRVQIKFPPTRLPAYQSRASRPHVQKNCVSIRDWGSAAKSGCRTTIRSGRKLARGERFLRTP